MSARKSLAGQGEAHSIVGTVHIVRRAGAVVNDLASVHANVSSRNDTLSWSHHREVAALEREFGAAAVDAVLDELREADAELAQAYWNDPANLHGLVRARQQRQQLDAEAEEIA